MEIAAFRLLYSCAQPFVDAYNERQVLTQTQLHYRNSKDCSSFEMIIIDEWLTANTKWLVDNEAKYNKCLALTALPKQNIDDLYEAYESLCGGNDDTRI